MVEQLAITTSEATNVPGHVHGDFLLPEITMGMLPEDDHWLISPHKKIQTPTNSRGLVDVDELIANVMQYVSSDYKWGAKNDLHHLNWPHADYVGAWRSGLNNHAVTFRELPPNKVWLPRIFHNVIHKVTLPPPMPEPHVMQQQIEAWELQKDFFTNLRLAASIYRQCHRPRRGLIIDSEEWDAFVAERRQRVRPVVDRFMTAAEQSFIQLQELPEDLLSIEGSWDISMTAKKTGQLAMRGCHQRVLAIQIAA